MSGTVIKPEFKKHNQECDCLKCGERNTYPRKKSNMELDFPNFCESLLRNRDNPALLHAYSYAESFVRLAETRRFHDKFAARDFFIKSYTHTTLLYRLIASMTKAVVHQRSMFCGVLHDDLCETMKRVESSSRQKVEHILRVAVDNGYIRTAKASSQPGQKAYYLSPGIFYWWLKVTGRDLQSIQQSVGMSSSLLKYSELLDDTGSREPEIFEDLRKAYDKDVEVEADYSNVT